MNWPICHIATHVLAGLPLLSSANNPFPIRASPRSVFAPFFLFLAAPFLLTNERQILPGVLRLRICVTGNGCSYFPHFYWVLGPYTAIIIISWLLCRGLAYPSREHRVTRRKSPALERNGPRISGRMYLMEKLVEEWVKNRH